MSLPFSMTNSFVDSCDSWHKGNQLDSPPPELLVKPLSCIVLSGLDAGRNSAHRAIVDILTFDRKSDRLPINYVVRPIDHEYPKAKPKKTSYEWYVPRGILKTHWMRKHLTEVPALVVIFYNFDWITDPQWREKQGECQALVRTVQNNLSGRSTKIVLVVIQEGASLPPGGDAISEERCASLCAACGLQLQNSLFILQNNEQLQGCCIKLESRLYELAQNYYVMETRKVKEHREFLNKTTHQLLFVRHHFKTGFLSEFVRPPDGIQAALRSYRQAFGHLMDVRATDYNLHEIKIIAGFISFKIWALSLLPGSNASQRDAELHFRKHVDWLRSRVGQPELTFEHFAWLASQYRIFADLFAEAIRTAGFMATISQHPGVYYHQAAILTRERRQAIMSASTPQLPKPGTILSCGTVVIEGQIPQLSSVAQSSSDSPGATNFDFFGQRAWRPGYQSLEPPDAVTEAVGIAGLQSIEKTSVDHSMIVTSLLSLASVHFRKLGSSRMCTRLSWETASELMQTFDKNPSNSSVVLSLLRAVVTEYRRDQWLDLLRIALLRQLECPRLLPGSTEFDIDYEQELAAICFELAALSGTAQYLAIDALVAFATRSEIKGESGTIFNKSLVNAWNDYCKSVDATETEMLTLDVSVLGHSGGFIQSWAHFPVGTTTLDKRLRVQIYTRRAVPRRTGEDCKFFVECAGVHLHFYYYYKAKTSSGATSLTRVTTKMLDVQASVVQQEITELIDPTGVLAFVCDVNPEESNRVVSAAASCARDMAPQDFTEAFVAISGWWVDIAVRNGNSNIKNRQLRLSWLVGEEPSPAISSSSFSLSGRDLVKVRQRNAPPKWIHKTLNDLIDSDGSPFLCNLKPKQAHVVLTVESTSSPALVGESYPVTIIIKNMNEEVATTDMCLDVVATSSSPLTPTPCLLHVDNEKKQTTDRLFVKIGAIAPASQQSVKAFLVAHSLPDVVNINLQLRCDSIASTDDAIVEVVRHSFSLPFIVPLSLISSTILEFDTLTPLPSYCLHRRNIISVKLSSSSPHDLELMSLRLRTPLSNVSECIATVDNSWPRHLRPGTSFTEAFSLPAVLSSSQKPTNFTGQLVVHWRRKVVDDSKEVTFPNVELTIDLPQFPIQTPAVVVRTARVPSRAVLFKPCVIKFAVKNVSETTLSLRASVTVPPSSGNATGASLLISGPSEICITLIPGSSIFLPVSFVPLMSGFMPVPRLRITAATQSPTSSQLDTSQLNTDVTDVMSTAGCIFVQTTSGIEWLLPGTLHSSL